MLTSKLYWLMKLIFFKSANDDITDWKGLQDEVIDGKMLWEDGEVYRISVLLACEQDCSDIMRRLRQIAQKKKGIRSLLALIKGQR